MPPPPVPGTVAPSPHPPARGPELALEIEFEQLWEASEEEMRRALWIREDGVELDEDPEGGEDVVPFFPSPNIPPTSKLNPPPTEEEGEDEEMEEGEEREEGEVEDETLTGRDLKEGEGEGDGRAAKRTKRERGRRNSRGGWELDEAEREAMRRETERCFGSEDGLTSR